MVIISILVMAHRFEVEEILNARTDDNGALEYSVKWEGFWWSTWEPESCLDKCEGVLAKFHSVSKLRMYNQPVVL